MSMVAARWRKASPGRYPANRRGNLAADLRLPADLGIAMLGWSGREPTMQHMEGHDPPAALAPRNLATWIAGHWVLIFILATSLWVLLPWLAPVLLRLGWGGPARAIYGFYSFQCHQLPQRSFFLFGRQSMYGLSTVQQVWQESIDPLVLRQFVGNPELGYKVAWSDRMVSAYSSIPLAGLVWWVFRKHIRPLSFVGMLLLMAPMAIDGLLHMASDLSGIGQGFRYTNQWLAQLTSNALPASFYVGTELGSFNSWMRLVTGVLFGAALVWFTLPRLGMTTSETTDAKPLEAAGRAG